MAESPTSRTLKALRKRGWEADIVERRLTKFVTKDFFGFADILAVMDDETLAVQCTTVVNQSARVKKVLAERRTFKWMRAHNRVQVWGWAKRDVNGKPRWQPTIREIHLWELMA